MLAAAGSQAAPPAEASLSPAEWTELLTAELLGQAAARLDAVLLEPDAGLHYSVELSCVEFNDRQYNACFLWARPVFAQHFLGIAALAAQKIRMAAHPLRSEMCLKPNVHVRLLNLPKDPNMFLSVVPRADSVGRMIVLEGTIIRTGPLKMLEEKQLFQCGKCKLTFEVCADREQFNDIPKPSRCLAPVGPNAERCDNTKTFIPIMADVGDQPKYCRDYQEIKLQEKVSRLAMGKIPRSIAVILEDDLVDVCKAGDDVTITGIVIRRWKPLVAGDRCDIELAIVANHVLVSNDQSSKLLVTDELQDEFDRFWEHYKDEPMKGRDHILSSFCPSIFGLSVVKLAVSLILVGGVAQQDASGTRVRGEAHMLLVGDPGCGKSQFLRYAAKIVTRSVLTTGIGSTNAGLTVTAVKDSGEWMLEAGALVLADRGLCCIDEFSSIRQHDMTAIHEAMEQQSISVAKAGLVCKLHTRCSILAATNPKGKYDPEESLSVNIALASPLLSRFDLVLVLLDSQNPEWDNVISDFILESEMQHGRKTSKHGADDAGKHNRAESLVDTPWPFDKIQAYFSHVKLQLQPVMTRDAESVLKKYYVLQRSADQRNAARTTIRLLESLIRLSQAHARLMYQDTVLVRDAVMAVYLMECSMATSALLGTTNSLHSQFPEDPDAFYAEREATILDKLGLGHLKPGGSGAAASEGSMFPPPPRPPRPAEGAVAASERSWENLVLGLPLDVGVRPAPLQQPQPHQQEQQQADLLQGLSSDPRHEPSTVQNPPPPPQQQQQEDSLFDGVFDNDDDISAALEIDGALFALPGTQNTQNRVLPRQNQSANAGQQLGGAERQDVGDGDNELEDLLFARNPNAPRRRFA